MRLMFQLRRSLLRRSRMRYEYMKAREFARISPAPSEFERFWGRFTLVGSTLRLISDADFRSHTVDSPTIRSRWELIRRLTRVSFDRHYSLNPASHPDGFGDSEC